MEYNNEICQGCGKIFSDGDDIVVCPECGTPQHRECYKKEQKCVNEHLHEDGFEWKPKHAQTEENVDQKELEIKIRCPFCGHENELDAKMCENCGQPFELFGKSILPNDSEREQKNETENYEYKPPFEIEDFKPSENGYKAGNSEFNENPQQNTDFRIDPTVFGSDIPEGETCGVSNRDIKLYVRTSPTAYYKKFKSIEGKKPTFNIGAFIFGYLWFFYRKVFKPGVIFLTLSMCLSIAFYNPVISTYDEMSSIIEQAQQEGENADMAAFSEQMANVSKENMPMLSLFLVLNLVLHLIMAFTADRLYKRKAVKDINATNEKAMGNDKLKIAEFMRKGGSSFFTALIGYTAQYFITYIITGVFFE